MSEDDYDAEQNSGKTTVTVQANVETMSDGSVCCNNGYWYQLFDVSGGLIKQNTDGTCEIDLDIIGEALGMALWIIILLICLGLCVLIGCIWACVCCCRRREIHHEIHHDVHH